jgi:hypothetical protein
MKDSLKVPKSPAIICLAEPTHDSDEVEFTKDISSAILLVVSGLVAGTHDDSSSARLKPLIPIPILATPVRHGGWGMPMGS